MLRNRRLVTILLAALVFTFGIGVFILRKNNSILREEIHLENVLRSHFDRLPDNAQGMKEFLHRETGEVFVYLPGGSFEMGITEDEADALQLKLEEAFFFSTPRGQLFMPQTPQHRVTLSHFLIAKHEVSQRVWKRVMGDTPFGNRVLDAEHPVFAITYDSVSGYCSRVGLSLPTEAQWEYACRPGRSVSERYWPRPEPRWQYGQYRAPTPDKRGAKKPNAWGLHDMIGNAAECCSDIYSDSFYSSAEASSLNPVCQSGTGRRVARGGAIIGGPLYCRPSSRWPVDPSALYLGFRPVFNLSR